MLVYKFDTVIVIQLESEMATHLVYIIHHYRPCLNSNITLYVHITVPNTLQPHNL